MPRKAIVSKRKIKVDPKYKDQVVTKFVNHLMQDGKKSVAQKIIYSALDQLSANFKKKGASALELLDEALSNVKPPVEVRSRRVGGATYQVPVDVKPDRALKVAMNWIIDSAKKQRGSSMADKLAKELGDAINNIGAAVKKKIDCVKMAEANRAFVNYRW